MRQTIKLAVSLSLLLGVSSAFATEGFSPIAYGAKARGMGGVSIATTQGAENVFGNPALMAYEKSNEASLGLTYLSSDIAFEFDGGSLNADSDATYIPYLAVNHKISDSFGWGAGLSSMSSLNATVDEDGDSTTYSKVAKTRLTVPFNYTIAGFSIAVAPIFEQLNITLFDEKTDATNGFGFDLGLAYKFSDIGLIIAADYKSKITHDQEFNDEGSTETIGINSPSEMGVGISWNIFNGANTVGLDFKQIKNSEIFVIPEESNMNAVDQNVIAIGYAYQEDSFTVRAGYRYLTPELFNEKESEMLGAIFPYNTSSHFTLGGSYNFNQDISMDIALIYETSENDFTDDFTVSNDQTSATIGLNYLF